MQLLGLGQWLQIQYAPFFPALSLLAMVHCAGCHSNFSMSGYTHHLRLTHTPSCAAAYHAQLRHEDDTAHHENDFGIVEDNDVFSGDYFGNYKDEDFDWPDDTGMSIVDINLHYLKTK